MLESWRCASLETRFNGFVRRKKIGSKWKRVFKKPPPFPGHKETQT